MNTKITDDVRAEYRAKAEEAYGRHYYEKHGAYPESAEGIYAERFISTWLCEQLALQRQREQVGEAVPEPINSDSDDFLRISMSGCSLKVGWGDKKRIVCSPHIPLPSCTTEQQIQWMKDAGRLCDGWNRATPPSPPSHRELLEKAIDACRKAKISDTGNKAVDAVHNGAVDDCVKYIRALMTKEEGKS